MQADSECGAPGNKLTTGREREKEEVLIIIHKISFDHEKIQSRRNANIPTLAVAR